jgi:uncharacterized membrane protein
MSWREDRNSACLCLNSPTHLETVLPLTATRSRWTAKVDNQVSRVQWEAEILFEWKNELIAWRSLPGCPIESQMVIEFQPQADGTLTKVVLHLSYAPSPSEQGFNKSLHRRLLGPSPEIEIEAALRRVRDSVQAL